MGSRATQHIHQREQRSQHETRRKQERARKQRANIFKWGALAAVLVIGIGLLVWAVTRTSNAAASAEMGDVVSNLSRDHIPEGTDPGPYSTNPPVGGHHFPVTFDPGFYSEADAAKQPKYPQGYLVHNLEHGYVIYWYNCQASPAVNCTDLQNAIKQVIQENNTFKVIGFPWPSQKEPLVMTSWGRILRLNKIDLATMRAFYKSNVDKGPEQTPN